MRSFWDIFTEQESITYDEDAKNYRWPDGEIVSPIVISCCSCGMTAWMNSPRMLVDESTEGGDIICVSCAGEDVA